jgi:hypothetical protein
LDVLKILYLLNHFIDAVKTKKKIAVFVLTIVFGLLLIIGSIQSNKANAIPDKSDFFLPKGENHPAQEKVKYKYIGMEKCATICHNNDTMGFQYNIMKSGPHSKAFIILASEKAMRYAENAKVKENPQESSVCLKCHITGGGLDSSSFTSTYRKDEGVTCEACHKGEYIPKSFLPKESDCIICHNGSVHQMHKFDFNDKCAKIAHPRPKAKPKEA